MRWLRAQAGEYHLDPNRFGVWGSSAGGHLVALVGTSGATKEFDKGAHLDMSSRVQAVCDYFGPTDLLQMQAHMLPGGRIQHDAADSPESRLIGGAIQENKEKAARISPLGYITPDAPPFLIMHGDQDTLVPIHQSQLLFEALKKAGVSVHFHTIHGAGHGSGFVGKNIDDIVDAFFEKHLKETPSAGSAPEALTTDSTAPAGWPRRRAPPALLALALRAAASRGKRSWRAMTRTRMAKSAGKSSAARRSFSTASTPITTASSPARSTRRSWRNVRPSRRPPRQRPPRRTHPRRRSSSTDRLSVLGLPLLPGIW